MTVHRTAYTPPPWLVDDVRLAFDLDPRRSLVHATLSVRRNPRAARDAPAALVLDGEQLKLLDLRVDGRPLDPAAYRIDERSLAIDHVPERCELSTVAAIDPQANTALSGLYRSNGGFFTQCEAQGFRRITWFPDRPDVMARYTVTLRAPRGSCPVLLSNGNLLDTGSLEHAPAGMAAGDEWHWATWHDPFPKPSYLFALVAARLAATERRLRTRSGRDVLLQVWVEPGNESRTGHAMASLERAIRWDEQRFGLELDLDRFMIVAVSDFNMGAMENKGLNIFNAKYVFADPHIATDHDFAAVESVVGHEYFHNWTGNRVTCRDWFQLTLKEGLTVFRDQEFSADMLAARSADAPAGGGASTRAAASARAVKRIEDVRVLRSAQFAEDAGPMAHPIRPDAYEQIDNFYTVTVYEKGAEVIRMLQTLVGREGFRRGLERYFERHDGQAVTCDDFVAAIGDANGIALEQFRQWYSQAGTPRVRATGRHDAAARRYTLELVQATPPTPGQAGKQPLHIPFAVGLLGRDGCDHPLRVFELLEGALLPVQARRGATGEHTAVLDLTRTRHVFVFENIDSAPVPSLARDFSAPVIVEHDYDDEALALLAARDSDPFNRWEALQRFIVASILAVLDGADAQARCAPLMGTVEALIDDETLDPAFREQLVTLPSEGFVAEQLAVVDPTALRAARNAVRARLADTLSPRWSDLWSSLGDGAPYSPDPAAAGRRALRNAALAFWVQTQAGEAIDAALRQLDSADNMTDRIGALQALLLTPQAAARETALARFAARYADEPLVLDKWFSLQATMHRQPGDPPVLERVRELMRHPAYSVRNPNRLRALVGSFCNGNLAEFHAADGSGYGFWVEQVLEVDALNPQAAARLARALDRWRKFDPRRQDAMREALERVAHHRTLSNDVQEIVRKSLAA